MTVAKLEAMAETQGFELPWQDLDELARIVVDGLRDDDEFIHMIDRESMGADAAPPGRCPREGPPARAREGPARLSRAAHRRDPR